MLFGDTGDDIDKTERCRHCKAERYTTHKNKVKPAFELKMLSCGEQIAIRLGNDELRKELTYPSNRTNYTAGVLTDIHDGSSLQEYNNSLVQRSDVVDVYLMLFIDGFVNQKRKRKSMTMIHANILNLDPAIR